MSDGDPILVAVWVGDSVKPTIQQTWLVRSDAWATSHLCSDLPREVLEEKGPAHLLAPLPQPAPAQAMGLRRLGVVAEAGMLVAVAGDRGRRQ